MLTIKNVQIIITGDYFDRNYFFIVLKVNIK